MYHTFDSPLVYKTAINNSIANFLANVYQSFFNWGTCLPEKRCFSLLAVLSSIFEKSTDGYAQN